MSFSFGNIALFKIDGTAGGTLSDISEFVSKVTMSPERDSAKLPRLGGNAVAQLVGPLETKIKLDGWYDPTADAIFATAMLEATPATRSVSFIPAGTGRTYSGECYIKSYEVETAGKDAASWKAELVVDGALTEA